MEALNLAYDPRTDFLEASFGPPAGGVGVPLPDNPLAAIFVKRGRMVGFNIPQFEGASPHFIPLLSGHIDPAHFLVPAGSPILVLSFAGRVLRVGLRDEAATIEVPDFAARATFSAPLELDLSPVLAHRDG